jgi:hypothetical protein
MAYWPHGLAPNSLADLMAWRLALWHTDLMAWRLALWHTDLMAWRLLDSLFMVLARSSSKSPVKTILERRNLKKFIHDFNDWFCFLSVKFFSFFAQYFSLVLPYLAIFMSFLLFLVAISTSSMYRLRMRTTIESLILKCHNVNIK